MCVCECVSVWRCTWGCLYSYFTFDFVALQVCCQSSWIDLIVLLPQGMRYFLRAVKIYSCSTYNRMWYDSRIVITYSYHSWGNDFFWEIAELFILFCILLFDSQFVFTANFEFMFYGKNNSWHLKFFVIFLAFSLAIIFEC